MNSRHANKIIAGYDFPCENDMLTNIIKIPDVSVNGNIEIISYFMKNHLSDITFA